MNSQGGYKNRIWQIETNKLDDFALDIFDKISGLSKETFSREIMENRAGQALDNIYEAIEVKAIFSHYSEGEFSLEKGRLTLGNDWIYSQVFELLGSNQVRAVLAYALTIGDLPENQDIFIRLMEDFWGTAYIDSARKAFFESLNEDRDFEGFYFSEEVGPGFYGMPTESLTKFGNLLELDEIGITVEGRAGMYPGKSVAGLFLLTGDERVKFPAECILCKGNNRACVHCIKYKQKDVGKSGG